MNWLTFPEAVELLRQQQRKAERPKGNPYHRAADPLRIDPNRPIRDVPLGPPGASLEANIAEARRHRDDLLPEKLWWFYNQVKNQGPWDYKQRSAKDPEVQAEYERFGNYNYGRAGEAAGIPMWMLLRAAGAAQKLAGNSKPEYGEPWGEGSYGDDPRDQMQILMGIIGERKRTP